MNVTALFTQYLNNSYFKMDERSLSSYLLDADENLKIQIIFKNIYGYPGIFLQPFQDPLRNHWGERNLETDIKALVIHSTKPSLQRTLEKFTSTDTQNPVSAHYVIPEPDESLPGGFVVQVVPEEKKAWHAGKSAWGKIEWLNPVSIGVELVNSTLLPEGSLSPETTWVPFHNTQINILGRLASSIIKKYNISPLMVLGHSDIAPTRKLDPGPLFPWGRLFHEYAVGAWLEEEEINNPAIIRKPYNPQILLPEKGDTSRFVECLKEIGYVLPNDNTKDDTFVSVFRAFKARFSRNQNLTGFYSSEIEEIDIHWAWALAAKYVKKY